MVRYLSLILLFSLFSLNRILPQDSPISLKQEELSKLKQEINTLQKELDLKKKKEKESFNAVEIYSRQGFLINKLLNTIREEERSKQQQISKYETQVKKLREDIKKLQDNYAKHVRAVYKYGKFPEWAVVIDAASVNQALMRVEYLRRFTAKRQEDLIKLEESKNKLTESIKVLEKEKKEKELLAADKLKEENVLKGKLAEKKKILTAIRTDKTELKKELDAKRGSEEIIRNLISKLVEEAERKRKEEAERIAALKRERQLLVVNNKADVKEITKEPAAAYDIDLSTSSFASFALSKGKLIWPVAGGKVIRKYGENRNKQLNTVTMNNGIDIKTGKDNSVKSVADGVISAIDWVPGYGSVVILTHKGDYRTVYGHLSEIFVKEGDKVKTGALIAKTAENTEGNVLHFEIWNSRANQNPEAWLIKK